MLRDGVEMSDDLLPGSWDRITQESAVLLQYFLEDFNTFQVIVAHLFKKIICSHGNKNRMC